MRILSATLLFGFLPVAICQENPAPAAERLHINGYSQGLSLHISALHIEREAPSLKWQPSVIHLHGDVVIRMPLPAREDAPRVYMIMHADEADYNEATGQIDPRGKVQVTFENAR